MKSKTIYDLLRHDLKEAIEGPLSCCCLDDARDRKTVLSAIMGTIRDRAEMHANLSTALAATYPDAQPFPNQRHSCTD
jgi:hypothetical protein